VRLDHDDDVGDPTVAAVVIVRNGSKRLLRAIESIRRQTHPVDQLVIAVDPSTDDTLAIARGVGGAEVLEPSHESGIANARNRSIAACQTRWVAFLDHDDIWRSDKIERQLTLAEGSGAMVCTGLIALFAESAEAVSPQLRDRLDLPPRLGLTPSAIMVRRSLFDQIGGFDPSMEIGCDSDWIARADRARWATVDDVVVDKELHESNISTDTARNGREMLRLARRHLERQRNRGG
jgi:glycosyltransferase involved in cell wall biosynthesis